MKKTITIACIFIATSLFAQKEDSIIVKMSLNDFQRWNTYNTNINKGISNKLDEMMQRIVALKELVSLSDTSTAYINSRAKMLPHKEEKK